MATSSSPQALEGPAHSRERVLCVPSTSATSVPPITTSTTANSTPSSLARQASYIPRQTSIYSLTLDEFQNALGEPGKNFGSMNMDEFLKNIWTAEESQAMAVAMASGSAEAPAATHSWHHSAQRQGSISLPRTLSRKTVEDVWKDIASAGIDMGLGMESVSTGAGQERQVTFSEMTLEDFLMKAGVVMKDLAGPFVSNFDNTYGSIPDDIDIGDKLGHSSAFLGYRSGVEDEKPNLKELQKLSLMATARPRQTGLQMEALKHNSPLPQTLDWLTNIPLRSGATVNTDQQHCSNVPQNIMEVKGGLSTMSMGLGENSYMGPDVGVGLGMNLVGFKAGSPSSPLSDDTYGFQRTVGGRKRGFEGSLEKVVERRQRRMIKNRESAARSRARKQAYTVELEAEVMLLKEENMRLRLLQEEMADMRRKQFIDVLTTLGPHTASKARTLRRTQTVPW